MSIKLRAFLQLVLVLLALNAFAGEKINVISLGDSWAEQWCEDMQWVIFLHGTLAEVYNYGIYGSTSTMWATPGAMLEVQLLLLEHPEIDWAVISLGGNDLLDGYLIGGLGDEVFSIIDASVRVVIDQLLAIRPNMKISLNGYDFPNFEHSLECIMQGQLFLGGNTYTQNVLMGELTNVTAGIAADYPQVYHTSFLGTLQEAGGVPSPPNYYRPSPAEFFPGDDECIHPTGNGGYWYLMQHLYENFFGPLNVPDDDDDNDDDNDNNDDDNDDDDNDDDDDDHDDDTMDDDAVDDDSSDDDAADDDTGNDDDDNDETPTDDDNDGDDDADDDTHASSSTASDEESDDNCGC